MLAMQDGRIREPFMDSSAQVADRSLPTARPQTRPHVSVWNRVSAFACIGTCTAVLWFMASTGARINAVNDRIDQAQLQIQTVTANNASLTATVDKLTQPTRILSYATNQLHMKYANPITIVASSKP
jgi:cell division protein FtsL